MKIRYEITLDDIVAYQRFYRDHSPQFRRGMAWLLFAPAAAAVVVGMVVAVDEQDLAYLAGGVVVGLAWIGACWLYVRWPFRATVRRLAKEGADRHWFCWHELELGNGMLVERSDHNNHATALRDLANIVSSNSHAFIYVRSRGAYIIPRRCVADSEYHAFIEAVRRAREQAGTDTIALPDRSNLAAPTFQCRACGKPMGRGIRTCRQCGRTWWTPIAVRFATAVAVKAGAICGGLFLHNPWLSNLVAWGGSLLAGYILLAVVYWVIEAFRTPQTRRRCLAEGSEYPVLQTGSMRIGDALLLLAFTTVFVLVGVPIGVELGTCLVLAFFSLAFSFTFALVGTTLLRAGQRNLTAHLVAEPEKWPIIAPSSDIMLAADSVTNVVKSSTDSPSQAKAMSAAEVRLRLFCAGGRRMGTMGKMLITLDDRAVAVGSLRMGFDARCETSPGVHELRLRFGLGTQKFNLHLPRPGAYEAELHYSSAWGFFYSRSTG